MESEAPSQPSSLNELAGLLEDHVALAAIETEFELALARKRFLFMAIGIAFGLAALVWVELTMFLALLRAGISKFTAGLMLLAGNGIVSAAAFWSAGRRDAAAGAPFEGTREQWAKTRLWIRQLFS